MTTQPVHDPHPIFQRALDQAGQQVAAVRPGELGNSTPCTDYDVRALLGHLVAVPWATLPGRVALDAYTHELTAHSWDLAYATERLSELDPDLAVRALEAFPTFAPPEARSGQGPFGPVVPVPDNADVYTQLATYLGRQP